MGEINLAKIQVKGEKIRKVAKKFELPPKELETIPGLKLIAGSPCSACISEFMYAKHNIERLGLEGKIVPGKYTIAIGSKAKISERLKGSVILLGKCLEQHKDMGIYAQGCPPFVFDELGKVFGFESLEYYAKEAEKEAQK